MLFKFIIPKTTNFDARARARLYMDIAILHFLIQIRIIDNMVTVSNAAWIE